MRKGMVLSAVLFFLIFSFQGVDLFGDEYLDKAVENFLKENPDIPPADIAPLGQKALPILMKKLEDEKSPVMNRVRAAELLLVLGGDAKEKAMTRLIQALDDSDSKVRMAAAGVLVSADPDNERVFNALYKKLDDPDRKVRGGLILEMSIYREKIFPKLKEILVKDSDAEVRSVAAYTMGGKGLRNKKNEIVPLLRNALREDSNFIVRKLALQGLSQMDVDDRETLDLIFEKIFHDPDIHIRDDATTFFYSLRFKPKKIRKPYFEKLLNKAIMGDAEERKNALKVIMGLKEFSSDFITFLLKARDPHDPEKNQRITELTLSLEKFTLLGKHPEVLDKLKGLTAPFYKLQEEPAMWIEETRGKLNDQEDDELRDLIREKLVKKRGESVCTLLCNLYANQFAWLLTDLEKLTPSLHFAMTSLRRLFFLKAAPFCGNKPPPFFTITDTGIAKEISDLGCGSSEAFQSIKDLAEPFLKPGRPEGAYDLYGKLFHLLWLQELLKKEEKENIKKAEIEKEIDKTKALLERDISIADVLTRGKGGSLFHSSLLSSSVLAAPTRRGMAFIHEIINPNNPLSVVYDLQSFPDAFYPHAKASVGRAVPAHLTLYRHERNNPEHRKNLIQALSFYRDQFPFLMIQLKRGGTHVGPYNLAPYYLYTSAPYATAAINLLLGDANEEEKKELLSIKEDLREMLLSLIRYDGLFHPDPFIPGYQNAMGGLALLPLAEEECQPNKKRPSLGILIESE